jgi:hypothetical protein
MVPGVFDEEAPRGARCYIIPCRTAVPARFVRMHQKQAAKLWHPPNDCAARIGPFAAITSLVLVGKPIYWVVTRRLASSAVSDPVGLVRMSCWKRRIDARVSGPKIPSTGP